MLCRISVLQEFWRSENEPDFHSRNVIYRAVRTIACPTRLFWHSLVRPKHAGSHTHSLPHSVELKRRSGEALQRERGRRPAAALGQPKDGAPEAVGRRVEEGIR